MSSMIARENPNLINRCNKQSCVGVVLTYFSLRYEMLVTKSRAELGDLKIMILNPTEMAFVASPLSPSTLTLSTTFHPSVSSICQGKSLTQRTFKVRNPHHINNNNHRKNYNSSSLINKWRASAIDPSTKALIFDCDGVIVESEELHRLSYNACWAEANLGFEWDYELYEKLQNSIGGGKEKMLWYFNTNGWPSYTKTTEERDNLIAHLHKRKTILYQDLIREGRAEIRPGVLRLMDEAHSRGLKTAICSAANANAVKLVLDTLLGKERLSKFDVVLAGDDVKQKKPDPMIYNVARERLNVNVDDCVVVEDTQIGLDAAKGAGMKVIITYTSYTANQEFKGAAAIYPNLGEVGDESDKIVSVDVLFPELAEEKVLG